MNRERQRVIAAGLAELADRLRYADVRARGNADRHLASTSLSVDEQTAFREHYIHAAVVNEITDIARDLDELARSMGHKLSDPLSTPD